MAPAFVHIYELETIKSALHWSLPRGGGGESLPTGIGDSVVIILRILLYGIICNVLMPSFRVQELFPCLVLTCHFDMYVSYVVSGQACRSIA